MTRISRGSGSPQFPATGSGPEPDYILLEPVRE